ncbi:hypothetical protein KY329_00090 [Candidatus Woesearchaeota archaeon]|nr:hypothetical protein [Candidatus Woesearchaeota archaeon]
MRLVWILAMMTLVLAGTALADPTLTTVTAGTPEAWGGFAAGNSVTAQGGNITPVNITGYSQTDAWQGFYGEITGGITLRDNSGDQLYNWSLISLTGEVYLSQNNAVTWLAIAGQMICTVDENLTGTGSDRVNNTFTNASLANWDVGGVNITAACRTYTYVNNASQAVNFEEIILNDGTTQYVYATKIYSNTVGYDGVTHDYQIIVPDNTTTATTTYYVYAEFT